MLTVKQVAELSGISVRTLHYYDEIGLFRPSGVSPAGYRLYSEGDLETLQQILFFRELGLPLKNIRDMMQNPAYDRETAFINQRRLLLARRNRLNKLLALLTSLIEGESHMSFAEFDMSEYFALLESVKEQYPDEIARFWGGMEAFDGTVETLKANEAGVARAAVALHGSTENYTRAMQKQFEDFPARLQKLDALRSNPAAYTEKLDAVLQKLAQHAGENPAAAPVQQLVAEWTALADGHIPGLDAAYWRQLAGGYAENPAMVQVTDGKYGKGASAFIGQALATYWQTPAAP